MSDELVPLNGDVALHQKGVEQLNEAVRKIQEAIAMEPTPQQYRAVMDGTGYEYMPFNHASVLRDKAFPIHRDEFYGQGIIFLGSEWVIAMVHTWVNVGGVWRCEPGVEAKRVTFKKESPHTPENVVDIGNDCKSAVSGALVKGWSNHGLFSDVYDKELPKLPTDKQKERLEGIIANLPDASKLKARETLKTHYETTADKWMDDLEERIKAVAAKATTSKGTTS